MGSFFGTLWKYCFQTNYLVIAKGGIYFNMEQSDPRFSNQVIKFGISNGETHGPFMTFYWPFKPCVVIQYKVANITCDIVLLPMINPNSIRPLDLMLGLQKGNTVCKQIKSNQEEQVRDFSGGTVDKTPRSQCSGPRVRSLLRELDTTRMPQLRVCMPQLRSPWAPTKEPASRN